LNDFGPNPLGQLSHISYVPIWTANNRESQSIKLMCVSTDYSWFIDMHGMCWTYNVLHVLIRDFIGCDGRVP
jgi:hypothetical protein